MTSKPNVIETVYSPKNPNIKEFNLVNSQLKTEQLIPITYKKENFIMDVRPLEYAEYCKTYSTNTHCHTQGSHFVRDYFESRRKSANEEYAPSTLTHKIRAKTRENTKSTTATLNYPFPAKMSVPSDKVETYFSKSVEKSHYNNENNFHLEHSHLDLGKIDLSDNYFITVKKFCWHKFYPISKDQHNNKESLIKKINNENIQNESKNGSNKNLPGFKNSTSSKTTSQKNLTHNIKMIVTPGRYQINKDEFSIKNCARKVEMVVEKSNDIHIIREKVEESKPKKMILKNGKKQVNLDVNVNEHLEKEINFAPQRESNKNLKGKGLKKMNLEDSQEEMKEGVEENYSKANNEESVKVVEKVLNNCKIEDRISNENESPNSNSNQIAPAVLNLEPKSGQDSQLPEKTDNTNNLSSTFKFSNLSKFLSNEDNQPNIRIINRNNILANLITKIPLVTEETSNEKQSDTKQQFTIKTQKKESGKFSISNQKMSKATSEANLKSKKDIIKSIKGKETIQKTQKLSTPSYIINTNGNINQKSNKNNTRNKITVTNFMNKKTPLKKTKKDSKSSKKEMLVTHETIATNLNNEEKEMIQNHLPEESKADIVIEKQYETIESLNEIHNKQRENKLEVQEDNSNENLNTYQNFSSSEDQKDEIIPYEIDPENNTYQSDVNMSPHSIRPTYPSEIDQSPIVLHECKGNKNARNTNETQSTGYNFNKDFFTNYSSNYSTLTGRNNLTHSKNYSKNNPNVSTGKERVKLFFNLEELKDKKQQTDNEKIKRAVDFIFQQPNSTTNKQNSIISLQIHPSIYPCNELDYNKTHHKTNLVAHMYNQLYTDPSTTK